jgi:putative ABC transport system permease protein
MESHIGEEIEKYGPNIVVTPRTQSISVPYGSVVVGNVTIPESLVDKIYTIPNNRNLRVLSPKIFGQVSYENSTLLIVGMDPNKEINLKGWWNISGLLPQNNTNEAIVGSAVKSLHGLAIGSTILIKNTTLTVVGLLSETGSVDDYCVFLPLHSAQTLLNLNDEVSLIDVGALCKDCPVEVISQQIMAAIPDVKATPVKQAVETRMKTVEQTASFSLLLASIILVVGLAGVMNTMLASVHERLKEIGIFMSLGADNTHLYKMFFYESAILGLIGGSIGTIVGLISSMLFGPVFIGTTINPAEIPIYTIPLAVILSILTCLTASLYPTWRASKIDPVKALRTV